MSIKRFFPEIRPTLDLNFAATQRLDPRITYTRASTGTFVGANGLIQSAAVNQARFEHNPLTSESLGLLVEEARTNLTLQSEDATGKTNLSSGTKTVTVNDQIAPDGTTTADTISFSSDIDNGRFQLSFSATSGTTYTSSFFIKLLSGSAAFDMWDVGSNTRQTFTATSNWTRCNITFVATETSASYFTRLIQAVNGVAASYAVWGHQIEAGAFPTSYIPTVASTVTRAADVASITGTNFSSWWNASSGSFLFAHKSPNTPSHLTYFYLITAGTGSTVNGYRIASLVIPADAGGANAWSNTVAWLTTGLAANEFAKLAFGFTNGSAVTVKNGVVQETNTESLADVVPTTLSLASNVTSTIARLTYWPTRLPNATLQAITQ